MEVKSLSLLTKKYNIPKFAKWLALFLLYFLICYFFLYMRTTAYTYDLIFGSDSGRVFDDWIYRGANHEHAKLHPLYVIINYCIVFFLKLFTLGGDNLLAIMLYTSLLATLNVFLFYTILNKISSGKARFLSALFTLFYAFSLSQLSSLMAIDSFLVGTTTLLMFWCYFVYIYKKNINIWRIFALSVLGVLCFSMTITNYFQFLIGISFLFILKKQENTKGFFINLLKMIVVIALSIGISYVAILIQKKFFHSTGNAILFFVDYVKGVLTGKGSGFYSEFSSTKVGFSSFKNIVLYFFGMAFISGNHVDGLNSIRALNVVPSFLSTTMSLLIIAGLVISFVLSVKKKNLVMLPFMFAIIFQSILHLFFGNEELMLYSLHITFLILLFIFIGIYDVKLKDKFKLAVNVSLVLVVLITMITNIVSLCIFVRRVCSATSFNKYLSFFGTFVFIFNILAVCATCWLLFKFISGLHQTDLVKIKKSNLTLTRITAGMLAVLISFASITLYVSSKPTHPYNPEAYRILLGMGNRKKFVLEEQKKGYKFYQYDLKTKKWKTVRKDITAVDFDSENYIIYCTEKEGNKFTIYENEDGIYMSDGGDVTVLDESCHINIPSFEGYTYQGYLKTLFYETMVNIIDGGTTPNFLTYGNVWYRDGALVAMVLDRTNNSSLLEKYYSNLSVDRIYDDARGGYNEPDNLGELLYILSTLDSKNEELINAILEEAKKIRRQNSNGTGYHLYGITDFGYKLYYETSWYMFGLQSLGLDTSEYSLDGIDTERKDVMWFFDDSGKPEDFPYDVATQSTDLFDIKKTYYPYLDFAKVHYYKVKLDIPENLKYPISFELQDWGLKKQQKCAPHAWSASEMLLYLMDYDTF